MKKFVTFAIGLSILADSASAQSFQSNQPDYLQVKKPSYLQSPNSQSSTTSYGSTPMTSQDAYKKIEQEQQQQLNDRRELNNRLGGHPITDENE